MKKLGQLLKSEREKQGSTLEEIAQKTKIGLEKLELIELGDYKRLPAKVFTRGLIKSYAKQLQLNVEVIIALFEEEYGGPKEEPSVTVPARETTEHPTEEEGTQTAFFLFQAPKSFFLLFGFAITVILCIFIFITLQKISSYEKEEISPSTELSKLDDFSNKKEQLDIENIASPEETKKSAQKMAAPEGKATKTTPPKKVTSQQPSSATVTAIQKIAQSELNKVENLKQKIIQPVVPTRDQRLTIEAFEPVRLEIFWSSGKPQVMLLKAEESKKIIFNKPLRIHLSDGGVVNITHNGKDLGVPGQIRKPIEIKYP